LPTRPNKLKENDLQAGKIDIGTVDPGVLTSAAPAPGKVGANWANLASKYNLSTGTIWGFNYAPFNFNKKDAKVAAVDQLYIRQALQESTDQLGVIKNVDKGYGFPSYTALPAVVPAKYSAPITNPYPFNLTSAKKLLTSHGWKIENGVQTCVNPGTGSKQCGAGITRGYTLNFSFVYASGTPSLTQEIRRRSRTGPQLASRSPRRRSPSTALSPTATVGRLPTLYVGWRLDVRPELFPDR